MIEISASLDPNPTVEYVKLVNTIDFVESIHIDIFDGIFVERNTTNMPFKEIIKNAKKPVDVHLTISEPEKNYKKYCSKTRSLSFQIEGVKDHSKAMQLLKSGVIDGFAINAPTPLSVLDNYLPYCNTITIMAIVSGKSGQKFMPEALPKITEIKKRYPKIRVIVDGGVNDDNIQSLIDAGADVAVQGTNIYRKVTK